MSISPTSKMLETLVTTDPPIGLFNRRHFLASLDAEWSGFQRYYRSVSVLMPDIDHSKSVNDRYGHAVGDSRDQDGRCLPRRQAQV